MPIRVGKGKLSSSRGEARGRPPRGGATAGLFRQDAMLFCTQQFLFFFLAVFAAYWSLPWHRARVWLLLGRALLAAQFPPGRAGSRT